MKSKLFNVLTCFTTLLCFFVPLTFSFEHKYLTLGIIVLFYPISLTNGYMNAYIPVAGILSWILFIFTIIGFIFLLNEKNSCRKSLKTGGYIINLTVTFLYLVFGIVAAQISGESWFTFSYIPFIFQLIIYIIDAIIRLKNKNHQEDNNCEDEYEFDEEKNQDGKLIGKFRGISLPILLWYIGLIIAYCLGDNLCKKYAKASFIYVTIIVTYLILTGILVGVIFL